MQHRYGDNNPINSVYRKLAIRLTQLYRTVSLDASLVVVGIPSLDLVAKEKRDRTTEGKEVRSHMFTKWQERWRNAKEGHWSYILIPEVAGMGQ